MDSKNNPKGFNVELVQAISKINGWKPKIKLMDWPAAESALRNGDVDVLLGLAYSENKTSEFVFSKAHSKIEFAFFTKSDARPIFSLEDLRGRFIGIHEMAMIPETANELAGFRQIIFNDVNKSFTDLVNGAVDVIFCPKIMGLHWIQKNRGNIIAHDNPIILHHYCFAAKKDNVEHIRKLDDALNKLKESGEYYKLSRLLIYQERKRGIESVLFYLILSFSFIVWVLLFVFFLFKKRRNIQTGLAFSFFGIGVIILLSVSLLSFYSEQNLIKRKINKQLQTVAELKAIELSQWLEKAKSECRSISKDLLYSGLSYILKVDNGVKESKQVDDIKMQKVRSFLKGIITGWRYEEVLITDTRGVVRLSTNPKHEGLKLDSSPDFWGAMVLPPGEIYIRDIHHSELTHNINISFSTGIETFERHLAWSSTLGVVILKATVDKVIYPMLQTWPSRLNSSEILLLRREKNRIICLNNARLTPDMALRLAFPADSSNSMYETISKAFQGKSGVGEFVDYRGIPVLASYAAVFEPISQTAWALVVKQDKEESLSEINRLLGRNYLILILFVLALTIIGFIIAGFLVKPIKDLEVLAGKVSRGDLGSDTTGFEEIKKVNIEEIKNLAKSFEIMIQSLKERFTRSEKMADLGKLSAGLAHEIRTPLTSIKIILQSLEKQMNLDPDQSEDILLARKEIDRLNEIVTRFLRFAQPVKPHLTKIDINRLLRDSLYLLHPKIYDGQIQVDLYLTEDLGQIDGDERQLSNLFLNVFTNSIEAMPDGGKISIFSQVCNKENIFELTNGGAAIDSMLSNEFIKISISDTGVGVTEDIIQKVFDPFFTNKDGGTGLGLSIAFSIVEGHKGFIKIDSQEQNGATIVIILPRHQEGNSYEENPNC